MRKILSATMAGAALLAGVNANAATTTTSFLVSATVLKACLVSAGAFNFPNYTPGLGAVTGSSGINVNCTKTTPFTVALNAGTTAGGTFVQRLLGNGANTLQYNLYTTNTYATVWGDGGGATATQPGTGSGLGTAVPFTVYGQLPDSPANQSAAPLTYTDSITVTVTF